MKTKRTKKTHMIELPTKESIPNRCIICGSTEAILEPRFNYYVCNKHKNIPPANIHKYKEKSN